MVVDGGGGVNIVLAVDVVEAHKIVVSPVYGSEGGGSAVGPVGARETGLATFKAMHNLLKSTGLCEAPLSFITQACCFVF